MDAYLEHEPTDSIVGLEYQSHGNRFPTVVTNLNREKQNSNDNKKVYNPNALRMEEYMKDLTRGWKEAKSRLPISQSLIIGIDEFGKTIRSRRHQVGDGSGSIQVIHGRGERHSMC